MIMCKVIINLSMRGLFMKNSVMSNPHGTLVVTIHRSWMRKKYPHVHNQIFSFVLYVITQYSALVEDKETIDCFLPFQE